MTTGHLHQRGVDILFIKVARFGMTMLFRQSEPLRQSVNGDHTSGLKHPCTLNGKLPHRPRTPDSYGVAGFNVRVLSSHVTGWKNEIGRASCRERVWIKEVTVR